MEKTYEHPTPSVRPVNGWIHAESEIQVEKGLLAGNTAEADMILKHGVRVKYTGRMRALVVAKEAEKALGLKPGMYFYPSRYKSLTPMDEHGNTIESYLKRSFMTEEKFKELSNDKNLIIPPTCDIHFEEVAYVCG